MTSKGTESLFDARRLERIKRQVMSTEEADAAVYDIALMQTTLRAIATGAESNPEGSVAELAQKVLEGRF